MAPRTFFSVVLSILLFGTSAWAQRLGQAARPAMPAAPRISAPRPLQTYQAPPMMQSPGLRDFPGRFAFADARIRHRRFRFPPVFFPGFGYPFYSSPYYTPSYPCDTRFSNLPYNCVPLYPNGPPSQFSPSSSAYGWENADQPPAPDPVGNSQTASSSLASSSPERLQPRDVLVTLDGQAQSSAAAGSVLAIGSGQHTLRISAKP